MSNNVYANGREIACKAGQGKSVCAFPDVCFTPPQTPATPPGVPIPYPNTGLDDDTTDGSKTVLISGKEVMLKDKSYFKKSMGDEAGCAPKKGVITSVNRGKVYFNAWSMDVKFEGENVVRHLDLTTHNHASRPGQTPPWPFAKKPARGKDKCAKEKKAEKKACKDYKPNKKNGKDVCKEAGLDEPIIQKNRDARKHKNKYKSAGAWADAKSKQAAANDCVKARRCQLVPYNGKPDGINGCCPSQTPDHVIPKASFYAKSYNEGKGRKVTGWSGYDPDKAPCICAEGGSNTAGSHGLRHAYHKANGPSKGTMETFDQQAGRAADSAVAVFGCSKECIVEQLKQGHKGMGSGNVKHAPSGSTLSDADRRARLKDVGATTTAE